VQLILTVLFAIFSDHWRNRPALMSVSTFWGFFTAVVLAIWTVPDGLKWFAFEMFRAYVPYGPISMTWAKYIILPPLSSQYSANSS
jgi:ACS family pantothenate transporter-like MFS transporter